jgi:hypothetical protein
MMAATRNGVRIRKGAKGQTSSHAASNSVDMTGSFHEDFSSSVAAFGNVAAERASQAIMPENRAIRSPRVNGKKPGPGSEPNPAGKEPDETMR